MRINLFPILNDFVKEIANNTIEIYNEASIQFELAIFLRNRLDNSFKIQLERNVSFFYSNVKDFLKKEMDIVIFNPDKSIKMCIELKYPRSGQYPEQMFSACKDVKFLEQLKESGFTACYFMMFAEDSPFYISKGGGQIYQLFRLDKRISGSIQKPTGKKDKIINIYGEYKINWQSLIGSLKCFTVKI